MCDIFEEEGRKEKGVSDTRRDYLGNAMLSGGVTEGCNPTQPRTAFSERFRCSVFKKGKRIQIQSWQVKRGRLPTRRDEH